MNRLFIIALALLSFGLDAKAQTDSGSKRKLTDAELTVAAPTNVFNDLKNVAPTFPAGVDSLMRFIKLTYKAPQGADGIKGMVIVTFYVEVSGAVTGVHITRGLSPDIDKEVLRVMALSPKWVPGLKEGKPAKLLYSVPGRLPFKI